METTTLSKEQAIAAFGTASDLARALGITPHAIYQWEDGEPIPPHRYWQLRATHPDIFGPQVPTRAKADAA